MRIINTHREAVPPGHVLTEGEILSLCCEVVPVDDCSEVGRVGVYEGADQEHRNFDEDEALAAARATYPRARILGVHVEGIGPPPGTPCGKLYESWEGRNNCCEGVPALAWNMEITPDVLPHGGSIIIAWDGGTGGEITVTTSSNATHFSDGRKSFTGYGDSVDLFAGETFCGNTAVTVSDACSEAEIVIRSDLGQWLDRGPVCGGLPGTPQYISGVYTLISGKYKQIETIQSYGWYVYGLRCAPGIGFTDLCFEPGALTCDEIYCREVLARKPAGAGVSTCLDIDMTEALFGFYGNPINCVLSDGTIIARHGFYSDSFSCPNGYGSNELHGGFYAGTDTTHLYEWSC